MKKIHILIPFLLLFVMNVTVYAYDVLNYQGSLPYVSFDGDVLSVKEIPSDSSDFVNSNDYLHLFNSKDYYSVVTYDPTYSFSVLNIYIFPKEYFGGDYVSGNGYIMLKSSEKGNEYYRFSFNNLGRGFFHIKKTGHTGFSDCFIKVLYSDIPNLYENCPESHWQRDWDKIEFSDNLGKMWSYPIIVNPDFSNFNLTYDTDDVACVIPYISSLLSILVVSGVALYSFILFYKFIPKFVKSVIKC